MTEKELLGSLAIILDAVAHAPYIWSTIKGKTRPHMFSWLVWTITIGTAFAAQISDNGGPGSWVTGFATLLSLIVTGLAIVRGEKNITRGDRLSLIGAFAAILIWYFTKDPLGAVILVTLIDVIGYYPTIRKSHLKPWEESIFLYGVAAFTSIVSLFALDNLSLITALYPAALTTCNGLLAFMLFSRRATLKKP